MKMGKKGMSIKVKTTLLVLFVISLLAIVLYGIASSVLSSSYTKIEEEALLKNIERAVDAKDNAILQMGEKVQDWSAWDDTHQFVTDRNDTYRDSNLNPINVANLNINAMMFADNDGNIIFKRVIDLVSTNEVDAPDIEAYFASHKNLLVHKDLEARTSGIVPLPSGAFIFVSQPILTSQAEGPINGSLTFGKYLDKNLVDIIGTLTHLSIEMFPYGDSSSPEDVKMAEKTLNEGKKYAIIPLSENSIAGYQTVSDVSGNPVLTMKVSTPREVYTQGQFTFMFFMITTCVLMLLVGIVLVFLLEYFVISRFVALSEKVLKIGSAHDRSLRISDDSTDEIGELATSINTMLDTIAVSENSERESADKALLAGEELKNRLAEMEKINKTMVDSELKMVELKHEIETLKDRPPKVG